MKSLRHALLGLLLGILGTAGAQAGAYDDALRASELGGVDDMRQLLDRGIDIDTVDAQGNSLLMLATRGNNLPMLKMLLERRPRPKLNLINAVGDSALNLAAYAGYTQAAVLLLDAGAEPVNVRGWSPLHYAALEGKAEVVKLLIARGVPVDAPAPNGATALMLAARSGNVDSVKALLDARANPGFQREGETALDWASKRGHSHAADLLRAAMTATR